MASSQWKYIYRARCACTLQLDNAQWRSLRFTRQCATGILLARFSDYGRHYPFVLSPQETIYLHLIDTDPAVSLSVNMNSKNSTATIETILFSEPPAENYCRALS